MEKYNLKKLLPVVKAFLFLPPPALHLHLDADCVHVSSGLIVGSAGLAGWEEKEIAFSFLFFFLHDAMWRGHRGHGVVWSRSPAKTHKKKFHLRGPGRVSYLTSDVRHSKIDSCARTLNGGGPEIASYAVLWQRAARRGTARRAPTKETFALTPHKEMQRFSRRTMEGASDTWSEHLDCRHTHTRTHAFLSS